MIIKLLLTSTSFTDAKGKHQDLLNEQGFEIDILRGPLFDYELKPIIANYDAVICGDDEYTAEILEIGKAGKLKYISKYGVGLDKINLVKAKELGIPVTNCPGVNQVSVAEHVYAMLLSFVKNIHLEHNITQAGGWKRHVSTEIFGKTIGIIGLGAIGKEVAKRAGCFGLNIVAFDKFIQKEFLNENPHINVVDTIDDLFAVSDIISLHVPHTSETDKLINVDVITNKIKKGVIIINTARGKLIDLDAVIKGLKEGVIGGYLADVLDIEPIPESYPLVGINNVLITPHIGSRTYESVERQGLFAVRNLLGLLQKNE
jgi:D-3-phosphoglycerate dehydrogenase / 2-oxoglutarate reductase